MHKPDQPIQNRNAIFHEAKSCAQKGCFYEARNLIRMEVYLGIGLTIGQRTAVIEAGKLSVSKRSSAFGRGLAGLWFKWSLGRELRSR